MLLRRLVLGCLILGSVGCPKPRPNYNYAAEPDPRKLEFVLGPSDVMKITVWHNPDLSGDVTVRPDGTITMPLVGDVRATGRTPAEIRAEITQRLGKYIKDESATVTIAVTAINSYRFVISGNVERGGSFSANHYLTLTEALALAGGPNRFATPEDMVIIRSDARGQRRIPIDYPAILKGTRPDQDLPILSGDTIYVP